MKTYYRAIAQTDAARPETAKPLAGGWCWFTHVEAIRRDGRHEILSAETLPDDILIAMSASRGELAGLDLSAPQIMGILNVTPDSFSDGGEFNAPKAAIARVLEMKSMGATLIDIGGESTRPGASHVAIAHETERTAPVIRAVTEASDVPISIDTRKAPVARAALEAGACLVNDVSGFTWDAALAPLAADRKVPVCVMHAQGDPATMQDDPVYENVLLDVYDFLEAQVLYLTSLGIPKQQIIVDPGIGFGKTQAHNLALLARMSLFHSLGCPILLGASRKRFIGTIGRASHAKDRVPGSLTVAMEGIAQGVQFVRVHDVAETAQALALWKAVTKGEI